MQKLILRILCGYKIGIKVSPDVQGLFCSDHEHHRSWRQRLSRWLTVVSVLTARMSISNAEKANLAWAEVSWQQGSIWAKQPSVWREALLMNADWNSSLAE